MAGRRTKLGDVLKSLVPPTTTAEQLWARVLTWPPDLFAVTSLLLDGGRYERIVDPPPGSRWPPHVKTGTWQDHVTALATTWKNQLTNRRGQRAWPTEVQRWFAQRRHHFITAAARDAGDLRAISWKVLAGMAELHAIADEASSGFGVSGPSSLFALEGELNLTLAGSLANFPPEVVRVVPKLHTPQRGMTLRSTSHHLSALRSTFGVRWLTTYPQMLSDESRRNRRLGLLLVPWPQSVDGNVVRPAREACEIEMHGDYGFFDFEPRGRVDLRMVERMVKKLRVGGHIVDGVVFPEAALADAELPRLLEKARGWGIGFVIAGVRGKRANYAVTACPDVPGWHYAQHKHHRWCLDGSQIRQYGFTQLDQRKLWWENIQLEERTVHFVAVTEWLTMCHVICEDLARLDPVDQVIRAVGPNLLVALLQDGPQIKERWASRFASVYADDPGCSVLTLTSLGMSTASRNPSGGPPSRVVGRWIDGKTGARDLELAPRNHGIFLSLRASYETEFTADGRTDLQTASYLRYHNHLSVQA